VPEEEREGIDAFEAPLPPPAAAPVARSIPLPRLSPAPWRPSRKAA